MLKSAICRARSNAKGAALPDSTRLDDHISVRCMWLTFVQMSHHKKKGSCTCVVDGCQSKRKNVVGREFSILSLNFSPYVTR